MEYFKNSLKSVLGGPEAGAEPTGAETVERLIDRLQSSSLLSDRRDACRALKSLSQEYRVEVGALGMDSLRSVLEMDRSDCEILELALETLCNITNPDTFEKEHETNVMDNKIGEQFTEIFIKQQDSVRMVLTSLEDFEFKVRWPALKLLSNLMINRPKDIQEILLIMPMAISKLMDLLNDNREVIRNNALLLLIQLTKANANIQKIVAFENAFDRIFDIISQEGGLDGGIIVEDCLYLMLNLLKGNFSNQNFFKEGSYIQRITPMIQLTSLSSLSPNENDNETIWSPQIVSNFHIIILVIRALVAPSCPAQIVSSCQKIMLNCGLLQTLCDILMASGVPADILTETINTVAEVIRGNITSQEFLSNVMAPSTPPRPAIVVLLMSMVNEKQPFHLRCSVLYCFQCFLYKNQNGQSQLIQTLLPQTNETSSISTGQLLCGGLFSIDPLSNWFSAVALSHALIDNPSQKELLLRVLLATNIGKPPVTLMQQCIMLLEQGNKLQSKLGLLILLSRWLANCPPAVKHFLTVESSISYLTALLGTNENNEDLLETLLQSMCGFLLGLAVHFNDNDVENYTKEKLCNLIEKRIGFDRFQDTIGAITRHEIYSRTLKHPQPSAQSPSDLLLDHEFCRLLKTLEGLVLDSVLKGNKHSDEDNQETLSASDSALVSKYKNLIRDQDSQIQQLKQTNHTLLIEKQHFEKRINELETEVNNLKDENLVLRAAQVNLNDNKEPINDENPKHNELLIKKIHELEEKVKEYNAKAIDNEKLLNNKKEEFDKLKKDQEDLLELLADLDSKLIIYKEKLLALGQKIDSDESSVEVDTDDQPESSNV